MRIWVDADACPAPVKEIVVKAAHRRGVLAVFVANTQLVLPKSDYVEVVRVGSQPDEADQYIVDNAKGGDLVITQDVPLAHSLVTSGIDVIDQRGDRFTRDNVGERLSIRDFMQDMRDSGQQTSGPRQFGERQKRDFAATFDKVLTQLRSSDNPEHR